MSMKWIITGGAGFIGCHAAERFHRQGHEVIVVDNLRRPGADRNLAWLKANGITNFCAIDIRDVPAIERLLKENVDVACVLHLAGQVAVTSSVKDPRDDLENNLLGTFNILESVRSILRQRSDGGPVVIYASTNKVYGGLDDRMVSEVNGRYAFVDRPYGIAEDQPLDFHSPYGCSKGGADQYVRDYARIYGMKTVTIRQSCIYGTRQFGVEDQGWIAWFTIAALLGRPITVYGDGKQVRDALWVEDLLDLYQVCVSKTSVTAGEVYNAGGGTINTLSLLQTLELLEKLLGHPLNIRFGQMRPGDQRVFIADTRKAQQGLNWKPKVSPEQGVARLFAWVKENRNLFD